MPDDPSAAKRPAGSGSAAPRFRPPRMLFHALDRPFLLTRVADGLARQIVVVHAPPGFGKTALMKAVHDRIAAGEFPLPADGGEDAVAHCGWLTIAGGPVPDGRFMTDIRTALGLAPGSGADPDDVERTLEEVARRPGQTLLFLDDIDHAASPEQARVLERILLDAPASLRVVCSSTRRPRLPLARLKARGTLTEIDAGALVFGRAEVRRLLTRSGAAADIDALFRITRGWPVLVQLAAELMPSAAPAERERLISGQHADYAGFVEEALLRRLTPALRRALGRISVLEDFPLDLAVALAPEPLSAADVALLDELPPLVETLAAGNGWYRLHPVVRACLAAERITDPQATDALIHARAAMWFAERGFLEKAVFHAACGGDFSMAAETIQRAGGVNLFIRAGHTVLEHLIDDLPADVIHASPGLTLCYVLVLAKRGHVAAGRERLEMLRQRRRDGDEACLAIPRPILDHIDGLLQIYEDRAMSEADGDRLEAMAATLPPHATWELGWIYNHLCIIKTRCGDLEAARLSALKALGHYREERTAYAQIFMLIHLGLVGTLAGQFSAALQFCREAQDLIQSAQWTDHNLTAISRVAAADILYLQGEVALVEQTLAAAVVPIVRGEGWVDIFSRLFRLLAHSRLHVGGFETAMAAIDKAEEVAAERALPRLGIAAAIMRIDILARAGMIESAEQIAGRLMRDLAAAGGGGDWTWRERNDFRLARARLALARGNAAAALAELEEVLAAAHANGSGYYRLAAEILAVKAAWSSGRQTLALEYLQSAVALARSHEVTQWFVDEGPDFAATVRAIVRRFGLKMFSTDAVDFMGRIVGHGLKRPVRASAQSPAPIGSAGHGLLSQREGEVLKLLNEGKTNKEIARALHVSEATVKFHLKNIYAKLGVSRRAMAQSVSRRLNLLV